MRICGGIVTYNPEMERLKDNFAAILSQLEHLFVFDNASGNVAEVEALVETAVTCGADVRLIKNNVNAGMAVALNALAGSAKSEGFTHILFLDQDSVAADNLISELSACLNRYADQKVAISCPLVLEYSKAAEPIEYDFSKVTFVHKTITSGSMVSVDAWEQVGGYDERLFVDWVDNEFCDNLISHGYKIIHTNATSILHEFGTPERAFRAPGIDPNGKLNLRHQYFRINYPMWRWEDKICAEILTMHKYGLSMVGMRERYLFIKFLLRDFVIERNRKARFKALIRALRHAKKELS